MKKNYLSKAYVIIIALISFTVSAQDSKQFWTELDDENASRTEQRFRKINLVKEEHSNTCHRRNVTKICSNFTALSIHYNKKFNVTAIRNKDGNNE